jgi:hypothetical protein
MNRLKDKIYTKKKKYCSLKMSWHEIIANDTAAYRYITLFYKERATHIFNTYFEKNSAGETRDIN